MDAVADGAKLVEGVEGSAHATEAALEDEHLEVLTGLVHRHVALAELDTTGW